MKTIQIKIIFLLFAILACSKQEEVLVEIKNNDTIETIKRKDLRFVSHLNQLEKKELSIAIQNQILEELAFITIGELEQKANQKAYEEKEIKKNLFFSDKKAYLNAINYVVQNKFSDFVYKFIIFRLLFLKKNPDFNREEEANALLKELNATTKEEELERIFFEKNENIRYKILAGYVEPFCFNCGQNPIQNLLEPLLNEKENKFILVTDSNGYWILKKIELKEIKESKIANLYEDYYRKTQFIARKFFNNQNLTKDFAEKEIQSLKQQTLIEDSKIKEIAHQHSNHQIKMLKRASLELHLQEMQKNHNFNLDQNTLKKLSETSLEQWNPEWVLFEYNQKLYRISDFYQEIQKSNLQMSDFSKEEIMNLLMQVYVNYEVLKLSPYVKEAEEVAKIFFDLITKQVYTNLYIRLQLANLQVSEDEIKKYYELRKNNEFKTNERILPLNVVYNKIQQTLLTEKRQKKITEVKDQLFKKYQVKIYKERLKEGKI